MPETITATKCGTCPSWEPKDNQDPASGLCKRMPIKGTFMMMFADENCLKDRGEANDLPTLSPATQPAA